jgi:DNA mismatch repair protein MutL
MASVREAIGRFNIAPSLDFENEALIDIPLKSAFQGIPQAPSIEINPQYNPFAGEENYNKRTVIENFEKDNNPNWGKLYEGLKKEGSDQEYCNGTNEISRKLFQIKNKYIICPVKSGLMLIDQKRAHERVLYEKYLKSLDNRSSVSQTDMFPVKIELNPSDYLVLKEIEEDVRLLGLDIQHLGNNIVSLNGFPADNNSVNPVELFGLVIEEYKSTLNDPGKGIRERVACAMARASSIPYGKTLTRSELEKLFDSLFACSSPNYSPTGKPVINIIALDEIDKKFR